MKVLLNSNLFPIISVGMYGTFLAPDSMFDGYMIDQDYKDGYINYNSEYFWDKFDNRAYEKHIEKLAQNHIDGKHECNGIEIIIKAGEIYSPREYNFATDNIDLTVLFLYFHTILKSINC